MLGVHLVYVDVRRSKSRVWDKKRSNMLKNFLEARRVPGVCLIRFEEIPRALQAR